MTQVVQRVGANGLQLPKELIERWGAKEGQEVIITLTHSFIRIVPAELDAVEIADRAATYVFDQVGDATAVGQPERVGERWRVPILLSYRPKQLGVLTYSFEMLSEWLQHGVPMIVGLAVDDPVHGVTGGHAVVVCGIERRRRNNRGLVVLRLRGD